MGVTVKVRALCPLLLVLALGSGCSALRLVDYALFPDFPEFENGEALALPGLREPVDVARRADGIWRIAASNERDAMLAVGYLQARDRMAQLDLFRHAARGELSELVGNRTLGPRSALETDIENRFLGFRDAGEQLFRTTSPEEREALEAFAQGVNGWIAEGHLALEHRLLGIERVRAWTPQDSLAIYQLLMHGLGGNADREVRRLAIACQAGLAALERIWPHDIEFPVVALPEEDLPAARYPPQPAVVPALAVALPELCRAGAEDRYRPVAGGGEGLARGVGLPEGAQLAWLMELLGQGWSASNNWAVSGSHTASGRPILSSDPHLPHMNPPLAWGMELEAPRLRVAGFTLVGLHRVVFGHNGQVAWGATTNHVDRQDLVVYRPRNQTRDGETVEGYELDGGFAPFDIRRETFQVRGGDAVEAAVRFTRDGPLLNDLDPFLRGKIPLTALRAAPLGRGRDLDGASAIQRATTAAEFAEGIELLDLGCFNWVFADAQGHIGYRSPCLVPVRDGWRGTFPVPGWLRRYDWQGLYPKAQLPASDDPERGWLATANNQIIPSSRFSSSYNNDASSPNRFLRIARRLREERERGGLTPERSAAIQLDTRYEHWPALRHQLEDGFCASQNRGEVAAIRRARQRLCDWDGAMDADSVAATLYVLLTHALLDRSLADELPGEAGAEIWRYAQSLLQFEANVAWLWSRSEAAPVWDDARTESVETRSQILDAALAEAVSVGLRRYGSELDDWAWGEVRPFVLRHPFAPEEGPLAALLNSEPIPIEGGAETPFKQQFPRSDREKMQAAVGPLVRITVDLADPWAASYSMAGGESGWPLSPHYGDLLDDWSRGRGRPLTPPPSESDLRVRLLPAVSR
jgi:penicillin amidase